MRHMKLWLINLVNDKFFSIVTKMKYHLGLPIIVWKSIDVTIIPSKIIANEVYLTYPRHDKANIDKLIKLYEIKASSETFEYDPIYDDGIERYNRTLRFEGDNDREIFAFMGDFHKIVEKNGTAFVSNKIMTDAVTKQELAKYRRIKGQVDRRMM